MGDEEQLKAAFRAIDKDGNGFITVEDLLDFLGEGGTREEADKADVDGDGHVNYEEFVKAVMASKSGEACFKVPASTTFEPLWTGSCCFFTFV